MHKRASASASLHSAAFNELNSHERAYVALAFLLTSPEAGSGQTPESERPLPWAASTLLAGYFRYLDVLCTLSKFITQKVCCINMHRSIDRPFNSSVGSIGFIIIHPHQRNTFMFHIPSSVRSQD